MMASGKVGAGDGTVERARKHTLEYHFRASSGMLYCFACSSRSLTSLGKTASKSLSLLDEDTVVEAGTSPSTSCCDL